MCERASPIAAPDWLRSTSLRWQSPPSTVNDAVVVLAIIVMLISTFVYSISYVLQHKGTTESMAANGGEPVGFKKLAHHRGWLIGAILFYIAGAIHILALSLGSVGVVQPLIVTELIFIPPVAAVISKIVVPARDWFWIIVVSGGLALFLIFGQPTEGSQDPTPTQWALCLGGLFVLFAILMVVGRRLPDKPRAAVLGTATGIINAIYVLAVKGALDRPAAWLMIILVVIAVLTALGGVVFASIAYRSGPVTVSSAAMIVVNPIVASVAAIYLFGDTLNSSTIALIVIPLSVVIVAVGIIALSASKAVHGDDVDPEHPILDPAGPLPE